VERIRLNAALNEPRPEFYYGSSPEGYTDYPFLNKHPGAPTPRAPNVDGNLSTV